MTPLSQPSQAVTLPSAHRQAQVDAMNDLAESLLLREPQRVYSITTTSFELARDVYPEGEVRSRMIAARGLGQQGQYALAVHAFREAATLCQRHGVHHLQVRSLKGLGLAHVLNGEYAQAQRVLAEALRQAYRQQDLQRACVCLNHLAFLYVHTGDAQDALHCHQTAHALAARLDVPELRLITDANLGFSLLQVGRLEEAQRLLVSALQDTRATGLKRLECNISINLVRLHERLNRLDEAEREVEAVLSRTRELKLSELTCAAQIEKARIRRRQRRLEGCLPLLRDALQHAMEYRLPRPHLEALRELRELHRACHSEEAEAAERALRQFLDERARHLAAEEGRGFVRPHGKLLGDGPEMPAWD